MASYLLTWNSKRFEWDDLPECIEQIAAYGSIELAWSCGNTRRIREGDTAFLYRQGSKQPGLMGRGWVTRTPYEAEHWPDPTSNAKTAWYVDVRWDALSPTPIATRNQLKAPPFDAVLWSTQASGISIPPEAAGALSALVNDHWGVHSASLPEEVDDQLFPEGGTRRVVVNAYERNTRARVACIEHYGPRCVVCGMTFADRYGQLAAGYIHVHHIRPLASIGKAYKVHPTKDLRPVCPNCHAFLHLSDPPMSIVQARAAIGSSEPPLDEVDS